jgi:hypothetical protein
LELRTVVLVEAPRGATTVKSRASKNMISLMKEIDVILNEQLDRLIESFKKSSSNFYQEYNNARIIVDLGTRFEKKKV